jgi:hypothetical protein
MNDQINPNPAVEGGGKRQTWALLILALLVLGGLLYWSLGRRNRAAIAPLDAAQQALANKLMAEGPQYSLSPEQQALSEEVLSAPPTPLTEGQRERIQELLDR